MDLNRAATVRHCFLNGAVPDRAKVIAPQANDLACPDPKFDQNYNPKNPSFAGVGWRSVVERMK
jgi:hypothetical protein